MKLLGKIVSTNITISVPGDLKQQMDKFSLEHPQTNWSLVARKAIQQYIEAHKGPAPQIGVSLGGTELIFNPLGPVLKTLLVFQNNMPTEITIDRIGVSQTLLAGIGKFIVSRAAWNMTPHRISPSGQTVVADYFPMLPQDLLTVENLRLVTSDLTIKSSLEVHVPGFSEPIRAEITDKNSLEDWRNFIQGVRQTYPHIKNAFEKKAPGLS